MMEAQSAGSDCWKKIGVWSTAEERCPELVKVVHCRNCPVYTSAGRHLLDREVPENYRREWTAAFAKVKSEKKVTIHSVFVFRTGGEWLALPAKLIQEVVEFGVIHTLPHRSNAILRGWSIFAGNWNSVFPSARCWVSSVLKRAGTRKRNISPPPAWWWLRATVTGLFFR